jgi:tetratricopeptide (TPR) repeat protein
VTVRDAISEIDQAVAAAGHAQLTNVLQISGNGNTVLAVAQGNTKLIEPSLPWRELPDVLPQRLGIPNLLTWQSRLAPGLVGRDTVLAELHEWARQPGVRVRFLSGRGGSGKSRLAAEFAEQLRELGWSAGFLGFSALEAAGTQSYSLGKKGLLLVVDDPEEYRLESQLLLQRLAGLEVKSQCIRVLLVSRQPLEWWQKHVYAVHAESIIDEYEIGLDRLTNNGDVLKLFRAVEERLQSRYNLLAPNLSDEQILQWAGLDPVTNTTPLIITAAAIQARTERSTTLNWSADAIIQRLAKREYARLENFGKGLNIAPGQTAKLVGVATLAGGLDSALARHLASATFDLKLPQPHDMATLLQQIPGWEVTRLQPVTPDIIGAALLFEALDADAGRAPDWLWAVLSYPMNDAGLIGRLGRISYDIRTIYGPDNRKFGSWLKAVLKEDPARALLLEHVFKDVRSVDLLQFVLAVATVVVELPTPSLQLRAARLRRYSIWLGQARELAKAYDCAERSVAFAEELVKEEDSPENRAELASCLNTFAFHCSRLRHGKRALDSITRAVDIRSELASHDSKYEEPLASSLQNLSNYASEFFADKKLGLDAVNRAISVYERIWQQDPDKHDREYARAMHNLSVRRWEHGDLDGSIKAVRTALEHYEKIYNADPGSNSEAFANSLMQLSHRLNNVGDHMGAHAEARQALEIRRKLARAFPASFAADMLDCWCAISDRQHDLGDRLAALASAQEAVREAAALVEKHPGQFDIDLAACKAALANRLGEVGRHREAVASAEEAVIRARTSITTDPRRQEIIFARVLTIAALRNCASGAFATSLMHISQAVAVRELLFRDNPIRFGTDYIWVLLNQSHCLAQAGYAVKAIAAAKSAMEVARDLIENGNPRFEAELAASHLELSFRYANLGFRFLAASHAEAAVRRYTVLADLWPNQYQPRLRSALQSLSERQNQLGQRSESLASAHAALDTLRAHFERLPARFGIEFADSLHTLADRQSDHDEVSDAILTLNEALEIRTGLAKDAPDRFRPAVASTLLKLAIRHKDEGRADSAQMLANQAIDHLRCSLTSNPIMIPLDLSYAFAVLSDIQAKCGHRDEALAAAKSAVELAEVARKDRPGAATEENFSFRLRTLSHRCADMDDKAGALEAITEATDIMRALSRKNPAKYYLEFVVALRLLWDRQRRTSTTGVELLDEAAGLLRRQALQEPWRCYPELARNRRSFALVRLSSDLIKLQLKAAEEAEGLFGELSARWPSIFGSELCDALIDITAMLRRNGRLKESRECAERAVAVARANYRRLGQRRATRLADASIELARCLRDLKRRREAAAALTEAIEALSKLEQTASVNQRTAHQYLDLARLKNQDKRFEQGMQSAELAIELLKRADPAQGSATSLNIADAYFVIATAAKGLGHLGESLMAIDKTIEHASRLDDQQRTANLSWLSSVWAERAQILDQLGVTTDAIDSVGQAINLQQSVADAAAARVRRKMADLHMQHSGLLEKGHRIWDALTAANDALAAIALANPTLQDLQCNERCIETILRLV